MSDLAGMGLRKWIVPGVADYTWRSFAAGSLMSAAPTPALCVAHSHPSLPGHFPGTPVVPGVVLLSEVLGEFSRRWPELRVSGIAKLKFLRVLFPEQPFTVEFDLPDETVLRFKCWQGGSVLAEGRLAIASARSGGH
jgi:3-hydroxyacyl-[acyl-carrier-protein] dehydratase